MSFVFCAVTQQTIAQTCDCTEYIYLNDASATENLVHKFEVQADGSLIEIGSPWLASGIINEPHGIASDLNGNLYIGALTGFANEAITGTISKLSCTGLVQNTDFLIDAPSDVYNFNYASKRGFLYMPNNFTNEIDIYSLCDGTLAGSIDIANNDDVYGWGFYIDDNNWYFPDRLSGNVYSGSLDETLYTTPATNTGVALFNTGFANGPIDPNNDFIFMQYAMGITTDSNGNFYIVFNDLTGGTATVQIIKFDANGNQLASVSDTNNGNNATNGLSGFWGSRGITYDENTSLLYVSNYNNCVTVFNDMLVEQTALNIGNPTNGAPKGIGIISECCPIFPDFTVDTTLCISTGSTIFLQDFINCEGPFCEGTWKEETANANLTFNNCDNSIVVEALNTCSTYSMSSDGTALNAKCLIPFSVEVEICVNGPRCINEFGEFIIEKRR